MTSSPTPGKVGGVSETEKKQRGGVQFKPGQSGNPAGRPPKGYSITEAFRNMLGAQPEVKAQIVEAIKDKALKGDPAAQKLIWQYMDGMPSQAVDLNNNVNGKIEVTIKRLD